MEKNHIWDSFWDTDATEEAEELLKHFSMTKDDLPILVNSESQICRNPTLETVARESGIWRTGRF